MGIENFFNTLTNIGKLGVKANIIDKIDANYFYIDFNSIIYNIASEIDIELNYLLYSLICINDLKCDGSTIIYSPEKERLNKHRQSRETKFNNSVITINDIIEKTIDYANKWNFKLSDKPFKTEFLEIISKKEFTQYTDIEKYIDIFNKHNYKENSKSIAIERIKEFVLYLIDNFIGKDNLNNLVKIYISFDGIPQLSKIVEQKRRRINQQILSELNDYIKNKYSNSLPKARKLFVSNKFSFNRSTFNPLSPFMSEIVNAMKSSEFHNLIHSKCPSLQQIIVSSHLVVGEGEKKIMEDILMENKDGKYLLFSPDADVVVLGMIMKALIKQKLDKTEFFVLRFNQQTLNYDKADIDILSNKVYEYVKEKTKIEKLDFRNVIEDIAFIFTLFGNDFVPKIESIDVRSDINLLLDTYCEMLKCENSCYLVNYVNNKFNLSYYALKRLMTLLAEKEIDMLRINYIANNYKNLYNAVKREKNEPTFNDIQKFLNNPKKITPNMLIRTKSDIKSESDRRYHLKMVKESLHKIHPLLCNINTNNSEILLCNFNEIESFTEYDIELYSLEHIMGDYKTALNAKKLNLIELNIIIRNDKYVITEQIIDDNKQKTFVPITEEEKKEYMKINRYPNVRSYYYENFKNTNVTKKMFIRKPVIEYLIGLCWVFDFYFNRNNRLENKNQISEWYYPNVRTPLLSHIVEILNDEHSSGDSLTKQQQFLENQYDIVLKSYIPREKYINRLGHYIYITPENKLSTEILKSSFNNMTDSQIESIKKKIMERIKSEPRYITNTDEIIPKIIEKLTLPKLKITDFYKEINRIDENANFKIDCRGAKYLGKCNILFKNSEKRGESNVIFYDSSNIDLDTFKNLLKDIIDIETQDENTDDNIYFFGQKGGRIAHYLKFFKQAYLDTKRPKYKLLYKTSRYIEI